MYTHIIIRIIYIPYLCYFVDSKSCSVRMECPCVVPWRPEALYCRVLIPPEARLSAPNLPTETMTCIVSQL